MARGAVFDVDWTLSTAARADAHGAAPAAQHAQAHGAASAAQHAHPHGAAPAAHHAHGAAPAAQHAQAHGAASAAQHAHPHGAHGAAQAAQQAHGEAQAAQDREESEGRPDEGGADHAPPWHARRRQDSEGGGGHAPPSTYAMPPQQVCAGVGALARKRHAPTLTGRCKRRQCSWLPGADARAAAPGSPGTRAAKGCAQEARPRTRAPGLTSWLLDGRVGVPTCTQR